jgi:hypothetical protein
VQLRSGCAVSSVHLRPARSPDSIRQSVATLSPERTPRTSWQPRVRKEPVPVYDQEGVRWLYSFLSADKRKTYCLYEAPLADAIRRAAARVGIPADAIVEVSARLLPDGSVTGSPIE